MKCDTLTLVRALALTIGSGFAFASVASGQSASYGQQQYFASTNGTADSDGSYAHPWDLQTALSSATVRPGDTVWVRAGHYKGAFVSQLSGSVSQPILVQPWQGEHVLLEGAEDTRAALQVNGAWTVYSGFDITHPAYTAVVIDGSHVKVTNSVIHHSRQALLIREPATHTELYGNIVFANGPDPQTTVEALTAGYKRLDTNVFIDTVNTGVTQSYAGTVHLENNLFLNSGADKESTGASTVVAGDSTGTVTLVSNAAHGVTIDSRSAQTSGAGSTGVSGSGLFPNSDASQQPSVVLLPNRYDARRAHLLVRFNGEATTIVRVDLSKVFKAGDRVSVHPAMYPFEVPIVNAIYEGGELEIPTLVDSDTTVSAFLIRSEPIASSVENGSTKTLPKLAVSGIGGVEATIAPPSAGAATYTIAPGTDIQSVVNSAADGSTFILKAGIHRMQSITPKHYQTFLGETGAILRGSKVLAGWIYDSALAAWYVTGQTQAQAAPHGTCVNPPGMSNYAGCRYSEALWFGSTKKLRVLNASEMAPGRWWFDAGRARIYVKDNPTGQVIETSVSRYAFRSFTASGVTIKNLIIDRYANQAQAGVIDGQDSRGVNAPNWHVLNNEVRDNHGAGIRIGTGWNVKYNYVHHQGQIGMTGGGSNTLIEGNEIAYNNTDYFNSGWEGGGTKWAFTRYLTVRNNYSHHNQVVGMWTDIDNKYSLYEHNQFVENAGPGINHEISFDCTIRSNKFKNNGSTNFGWVWNPSIQIQNSSNCTVYGNHIETKGSGITVVQQSRGTSGSFGVGYVSINNRVTSNIIKHTGSTGVNGVGGDYLVSNLTAALNKFDANTYYVPAMGQGHWHSTRGIIGFAAWKGLGHDPSSTERATSSSYIPPVSVLGTFLPGAPLNRTYTRTLSGIDGVAPYAWSLVSGTLPPGLTVQSSGVISGVATAPGTFTFVIQVRDARGSVDSQPFSVVVQ